MVTVKQKKTMLDVIFDNISKDDCIVFLFGSYANGENIQSSDIDIGLLYNNNKYAKCVADIEEELNSVTLKKIDLVDFATVSGVVKKEALKEIKIWHIGKNCRALLKDLKPGSTS